MTYIKVICKQSTPFEVCGFELCLPGKDRPVNLLQDPADHNAPQIYKFSEYSASRFDRSQLIFQSGKTLRREGSLEGYLLATDPDPIPLEMRQGARVIAKLTIFDQFDAGHSSDLILCIDRSAEWGPKPRAAKPLRRLFDHPDKVDGKLLCDTEAVVAGEVEILELAGIGK